MENTVYLHIGVEKTGTSFLQSYMAKNRANLEKVGYYYPSSPGTENHVLLPIYAAPMNTIGLQQRLSFFNPDTQEFQRKFRKRFLKEINPKYDKGFNIVLSSEHFSSRLHNVNQIERIKTLLEGKRVKVILYLRRQDDLLVSLYSTSLKSGNAHKFSNFLNRSSKWFNYKDLFNLWSRVFGETNIEVRLYGKSYFYKNSLLKDFLHTLGLEDFDGEDVDVNNTSLDIHQLKFLELFNKIAPEIFESNFGKFRNEMVQSLESTSGNSKISLSTNTRNQVMERFLKSNAILAKRIFGREQLFEPYDVKIEDEDIDVFPRLNNVQCVKIAATLLNKENNDKIDSKESV